MIDWSKLKPYQRDKYRSFEELCYQVARGLYGAVGFTPVDDSGGGDGVEFYRTLPDGREWGWQAKFYYPNQRLRRSGRKASIQNSLAVACEKHPELTRWILCTPSNLTPAEQKWFDEKLPRYVPDDMEVEIHHWGDSEFNAWLSEPRFVGKHEYFFGDLELTLEWFRSQVERQTAAVQDKFIPTLHTETDVDHRVHGHLGDELAVRQVSERHEALCGAARELEEAVDALCGSMSAQIDWGKTKSELIPMAQSLQHVAQRAVEEVGKAIELLAARRYEEVKEYAWDVVQDQVKQEYQSYGPAVSGFDISQIRYTGSDESREQELRKVQRIVRGPARKAESVMAELYYTTTEIERIGQDVLHILGQAGVGKTHLACHICDERLEAELPALLILGEQFTTDRSLTTQLREILDIPPSYSWGDFLRAMAAAAEAYRTRIPIMIDGLNGTVRNGRFPDLWRIGLPSLAHQIATTSDVVLITTCRTSYREAIWPGQIPENVVYARVFDAYSVETAVAKYFEWYKIRADLTGAPLDQFRHPIYLRIFCEIKNPAREREKHIYVGEQTLFSVFDEYLAQCNTAVCSRLGFHPGADVIVPALQKMASYLWHNHCRSIPLDDLTRMIDGRPLDELDWSSSKTEALLSEGLLLCRDWRNTSDIVFFTYDLLGGYLIAQCLIEGEDDIETFVKSKHTVAALFGDNIEARHPLQSDIGRCLAAMIPMRIGKYLHNLSQRPVARELSYRALFEISASSISEEGVDLIARLFEDPENRRALLARAASTVGNVNHPLNASYWSDLLKQLDMCDRDLCWTEYVRANADDFEKDLAQFETTCRDSTSFSDMTSRRLGLLAEHFMWVLTSTVRPLRDRATRSLYWYGRRFPERFLDLVVSSLEINDPYIPERMLAVTYGVAMARQHDFSDPSFARGALRAYGRQLYEAMFESDAPCGTTHILARDYARRTIDICISHHPSVLTPEEKKRITPPFQDGGIREWGKAEDRNEGEYQRGNAPIHMDFANYTLGTLVKDRSNYDFEHEEYQQVRANTFWRIYDLGYSLEAFGEIDKWIAHENIQYARAGNGRKTDRYGKKYSWIAFYELAGLRKDQGLLADQGEEFRISDADIDPSFPDECQEHRLITADYLGDRDGVVEEWILDGGLPDLDLYLVVEELVGEHGPWVLLDGYVRQEDLEARRSRFIFPRGLIVDAKEAEAVADCLEEQDLAGRWLPEIPSDYYTYAGEIPWCDMYPFNGRTQLKFTTGTRVETGHVKRPVLLRDGEPISEAEENEFWRGILHHPAELGELRADESNVDLEERIQHRLGEMDLDVGLRQTALEREVNESREFDILIPVRENSWEDHHSSIVPGRNVLTAAKEIAQQLDLCGQPQTFDLFEKQGERASIALRYGETWHTYQKLVYLRRDLLKRFLDESSSVLVWAIWGEREFRSRDVVELRDFSKEHQSYRVFQQIRMYCEVAQDFG